ncbi:BgTH12-02302 [Blumeria graminis f. sp. triticale]|uniref:Non-structural maintenance of chromosomes element 4 n=4 Tax=Blumeria graminis TaxID=34373 RepID=A0A9X9MGF8_BLUGR|nr:BgTH12-02302 [Blumeria graminis f. sp. triticale]VDB86027.1 Bgt-3300 [Blumeria graminis f. sp. tritici]
MARTSKALSSPDPDSDGPHGASSYQTRKSRSSSIQQVFSSLSPASSVSERENLNLRSKEKQKQCVMKSRNALISGDRGSKINIADQEFRNSQTSRRRSIENENNSDENYDPDQNIEERRKVRKGLRDLNRILVERRNEYLNPSSTGLEDTITQANTLSRQVKQTSDATIDSNLLVTAADITYKRTIAIISGETGQGMDLDDFINKCKAYIRLGEGSAPTQGQKNQGLNSEIGAEVEDEESDEVLNWEYLGRNACAPYTGRPCVPGFLLGPLSTEKKAKRSIVRKAALRIGSMVESRPEILRREDIVRDEDLNLSNVCQKITKRLEKIRGDAMSAVELETKEDMTEEEADSLLDKYDLSRDAGISFFKFVINPYSFGQTVENLFYVSFLIRDGKMAVTMDERGMPYLELRDDEGNGNVNGTATKHQAVLSLDMASWKEMIQLFDIKDPMILHRNEPESRTLNKKGWYA